MDFSNFKIKKTNTKRQFHEKYTQNNQLITFQILIFIIQ